MNGEGKERILSSLMLIPNYIDHTAVWQHDIVFPPPPLPETTLFFPFFNHACHSHAFNSFLISFQKIKQKPFILFRLFFYFISLSSIFFFLINRRMSQT